MAVRDAREYLYTMLNQYLEMQSDLKDFEKAFEDGYITEDRLEEVRYDVGKLKENYDRIQYILFLIEEPKREAKKDKFRRANADIYADFAGKRADLASVKAENESITAQIKKKLKELTKGRQA